MSTSLRSCIQFVALIGGLVLAVLIFTIERRTLWSDLMWIGIVAVPTLLAVALLVWDPRRMDRETDFLVRQFGRYFEYKGFGFVVKPVVADGYCCFNVYYQNRYERDCIAVLCVAPSRGFFLMRGKGVSMRLPLQIPGGAVGGVRVPLDLPESVLGKACRMDVTANVKYPGGRGRKLRFYEGMRVSKMENPNWERFGLALNLLIAPTGSMAMTTPAHFEASFPVGSYQKPTADVVVVPRVLWKPGDGQAPDFVLQ